MPQFALLLLVCLILNPVHQTVRCSLKQNRTRRRLLGASWQSTESVHDIQVSELSQVSQPQPHPDIAPQQSHPRASHVPPLPSINSEGTADRGARVDAPPPVHIKLPPVFVQLPPVHYFIGPHQDADLSKDVDPPKDADPPKEVNPSIMPGRKVHRLRYFMLPPDERRKGFLALFRQLEVQDSVACSPYLKSEKVIKRFEQGLRAAANVTLHRCASSFLSDPACDWVILYGVHFLVPYMTLFQMEDKATLVVEYPLIHSYLKNKVNDQRFYSLVWNGLNGNGFRPRGMPSDRWDRLFRPYVDVRAWRENKDNLTGELVVIIGQQRLDPSLDPIRARFGDPNNWYQNVTDRLNELFPETRVVFRPHPYPNHVDVERPRLKDGTRPPKGAIFDATTPLDELIDKAFCVVTMTSGVGAMAVIRGTPVVAYDPLSTAWEVTSHDVADMRDLRRPDRTQWLNDLAYAQWDMDEIISGEAFKLMFDKSITMG